MSRSGNAPRRLPVLALAIGAVLPQGACGSCLLVLHRDVVLALPDGERHAVRVDYHVPHGLLWDGNEETWDIGLVQQVVFGLLLEPVDILFSTAIAATSVVQSDTSVMAGPLGWLASLTPFATLVPAMHLAPPTVAPVDAATVAALRDNDPTAMRRAFPLTPVFAVHFAAAEAP
ncbi:MAG: hypothetical protein KF830_04905 [Planctomycetes bacterium]|nr:hypothetical protein [Planctomycetota bacterium]